MGKAISRLGRRTVKNWNVENRAHREIERQEKRNNRPNVNIPKTAPRHSKTDDTQYQISKG